MLEIRITAVVNRNYRRDVVDIFMPVGAASHTPISYGDLSV